MNENQKMIGVYFSGTGNSRYAVEHFVKTYDKAAMVYSIEDSDVTHHIEAAGRIVFGYPVQYSNVPKIVKDFVDQNKSLWRGKKIFVIATMGLFSGDGAGILARRLEKHGAMIIGGLHLKMADSIADEKALKRHSERTKSLLLWLNKRSNAQRMIQKMEKHRRKESDFYIIWLDFLVRDCIFITRQMITLTN
ncbi:MAG: EFR1 family ferrodoxin [Lachnospiraceae bacterium]